MVSGGISLSGSTINLSNPGATTASYYVVFGYMVGTPGAPSFSSIGLEIAGVVPPSGSQLILSTQQTSAVGDCARIIQAAAGGTTTLQAVNLSGATVPLHSSAGNEIVAFLTIFRIE